MKGIFISCPDCKKLMLKNVRLRVGSYFSLKCFSCGSSVDVRAEVGKIVCQIERKVEAPVSEDDEDTIFFSTS